jgi:hypothetical protein
MAASVESAANQKVLQAVASLYNDGLSGPTGPPGGAPGSLGLAAIAAHPLVQCSVRRPRKKIRYYLHPLLPSQELRRDCVGQADRP